MPTIAIDRLPRELFTDILLLTLPQPIAQDATYLSRGTLDTIQPRKFLRVCRNWRHVVLTTQLLWTHWVITLYHADDACVRMAARLLQQCLALSGDLPLSFRFVFAPTSNTISRDAEGALKSAVAKSQRRWGWAVMRVYRNWDTPVEIAASSLRELQLRFQGGPPTTIYGGSLLTKLTVLDLQDCDFSYLSLLPLAPNLESLSLRGFGPTVTGQAPFLPRCVLERLRSLRIGGLNVLGNLSCPALQHFYSMEINPLSSSDIQHFVERNNLRLRSLKLRTYTAGSFVPTLRSLPSLQCLHLLADPDKSLFTELAKANLPSGQFTLCPMLRDVTLAGATGLEPEVCTALARFIETRWRTAFRTIKRVEIQYAGADFHGGPWESVTRCMEEGLEVILPVVS